jgi:hypothetical protein
MEFLLCIDSLDWLGDLFVETWLFHNECIHFSFFFLFLIMIIMLDYRLYESIHNEA